ncbi:MAG: glycoside hydrolase [Rhodocyclales bacterium]|nr:glycoside hydrolase [Rhodocyclales bacterium]
MKIAYITETWPPELNGVALTAARVVNHLRTRGHGVELVRPRQYAGDAGDAETVTVPGVPLPMYRELKFGLPARQRLLKRWRQSRPDVVHIATEGPLGWSACSAARALDIPVTSDFRTRFDEYGGIYGVKAVVPLVRAYLRGFHNRTACTFVPTEEIATELSSQGFRNLVVSGRGVDGAAYSPFYRSESLRRSWKAIGPVALYVGRLAAEKNLMTVVEAFEAIQIAEPTAQLVFVGDGPMREELEARCPYAIFAGYQRGSILAAYYASADMFLFPSLTETFGNVTLEAMASGLPVVAYDTAAAGVHIQDEVNGMTVAPGDQFAFVRAAVSLACDEPLRERLGEAARQTARSASWSHILADFELALHANCTQGSSNDIRACLV